MNSNIHLMSLPGTTLYLKKNIENNVTIERNTDFINTFSFFHKSLTA